MKVMKTLLAMSAISMSCAVNAQVEFNFHRDLAPIIIKGEEIGFSFNNELKHYLDNGENQLVFRMSRVIEGLSGEREKFNSKAMVLMFDAENKVINLAPTRQVLHESQANEFNRNPEVTLTDEQGNNVDFTIDVLPIRNSFTSDYRAELAHFNKIHGIEADFIEPSQVDTLASTPAVKIVEVKTGDVAPVSMIEYWMKKASSSESEQFMDWAFKNRTVTELNPVEGTQTVNMLTYWYSQANIAERKQILAWLLTQ